MRLHHAGRAAAAMLAMAAFAATLLVPSTALAAVTSFSTKVPASGSSTLLATPKISIAVYDKYGIKYTSSFTMKVDGKTVKPKITYKKSRDYRRMTVTFQVTTKLAPGSHTIYLKIKDIKKKTATVTWKFNVLPPPVLEPSPMPMTISAGDCGACHVGYPAAHPMTACESCHGVGRPLGDPARTASDESPHTLSCSLAFPCHGDATTFPHVLGSDCDTCHSGAYTGIPTGHAVDAEAAHASSSTRCTTAGCHLTSLTKEHYRRTIDGKKASCATCHSSTDPRIVAAIRAGSTACESCHTLTAAHSVKTASHTFTGSCVLAGCHEGSVVTVHTVGGGKGCGACHTAGQTLATSCEGCHSSGTVHASAAAAHAATNVTCVTDLCHIGDVAAIHGVAGGPGCPACHAPGKVPTTNCVTCHPGALEVIHPRIGTAHKAAPGGCVSAACHVSDVTALHGKVGGPGCAACHEAGTVPTISCVSCHPGDLTMRHGFADPDHVASTTTTLCVNPVCHPANVATAHAAGLGCLDCHGPGATASNACSSCHSKDPILVHPKATAAHTAPASACVSSTCHGSSVTTLHAKLTASGCPTCHKANASASLDCVGCHTGDLVSLHPSANTAHTAPTSTCVQSGCHAANAAVLHAALTGSGCPTCHGPSKTPSLKCATCHPAADMTPRHAFADAAHAAPASSCVTADCHAANVAAVHGQVGGPGCGACHAPSKTPSLICSTCHAGDMTTLHAAATTAHTAATSTCIQTACHVADAASLHTKPGGPGCAACHAAGKTASIACANCHPGDLTGRHAFANASHAAPASSCVSADCHAANAASAHGLIGGPGCAACHAPGKTPSLTCATCHPGDVTTLHLSSTAAHAAPAGTCVQVGCHVTDAAVLHTQKGGPGCSACHAAGKTATLTCATCHPGDLNPRHTFADPAHTAGAGLCISSTCHVSNVATIHAAGLGCVDCHGPGKTPSLLCATCHTGDLVTLHPSSAPKHAAPASTCVQTGCHVTDAARVHTAPGGPGCPACHAAGKTPALTCATCHPGGLTTHSVPATAHAAATGTCVTATCHVSSVATIHAPGLGCIDCHALGKKPSLLCSTCHSSDLVALHPKAVSKHAAPASNCVQTGCHAADAAGLHTAVGGPGCAACHATGKTLTLTCATCHAGGFTTHPVPAAPHTAPSGSCVTAACHVSNVATIHATGLGCVDCHALGRTPSLVCADCHTGDLVSLHPSSAAKHTAPASNCVQTGCHATDAARVHTAPGGPGCAACHATGKTATLACATCHPGGFTTHPAPASLHTVPTGTCVSSSCHLANVASIHATGLGCVDCHALGKTPSLACTDCHAADLVALHPAAVPKHAASASTCVQGGCHTGDAAAAHMKPGGPGCAACHADGKTPSTKCTFCHAGDVTTLHPNAAAAHTSTNAGCAGTGCHVTDVSALHGAAGGPGCAACHAAGKTPSLTCSTCHPGKMTAIHAAGDLPHTAPNGTCVQTGCHVSNVSALHLNGPACAPCHGPGSTTTIVCATCHAGDVVTVHQAVVGTKHDAPTGACVTSGCHVSDVSALHGVVGGPGCAACHAVGKTPSLDCGACHDAGFATSHPAPAAAHTAPADGPCSPCHDTNVATLHGVAGGPACAACHAVGKTPTLTCSTCHPASTIASKHPSGTSGHTTSQHPCTSTNCHPGDVATNHAGSDESCAACHTTGQTATNRCLTCHPQSWSYQHPAYSVIGDFHGNGVGTGYSDWGWSSSGTILAPYTRGMNLPCATCHTLTGTPNLYNFPTVVNGHAVSVTKGTEYINLCVACHGGSVDSWHGGCFDCHGSGMTQPEGPQTMVGSDCSQCHHHGGGWPHGIGWMTGPTL